MKRFITSFKSTSNPICFKHINWWTVNKLACFPWLVPWSWYQITSNSELLRKFKFVINGWSWCWGIFFFYLVFNLPWNNVNAIGAKYLTTWNCQYDFSGNISHGTKFKSLFPLSSLSTSHYYNKVNIKFQSKMAMKSRNDGHDSNWKWNYQ